MTSIVAITKSAQRTYHLKLHLVAYVLVLVGAVVLPVLAQH
jgi:hypothetical protein